MGHHDPTQSTIISRQTIQRSPSSYFSFIRPNLIPIIIKFPKTHSLLCLQSFQFHVTCLSLAKAWFEEIQGLPSPTTQTWILKWWAQFHAGPRPIRGFETCHCREVRWFFNNHDIIVALSRIVRREDAVRSRSVDSSHFPTHVRHGHHSPKLKLLPTWDIIKQKSLSFF